MSNTTSNNPIPPISSRDHDNKKSSDQVVIIRGLHQDYLVKADVIVDNKP